MGRVNLTRAPPALETAFALTLLQLHLPGIQRAMQNTAIIQLRVHSILRQLRCPRRETSKVGRRALGVAGHHPRFWFAAGFCHHVGAMAVCRLRPLCIPNRARSKVLRKETWRLELPTVGALFLLPAPTISLCKIQLTP